MAKDRSALNAFLKEAGFATLSGDSRGGAGGMDLMLFEPSASETKEVRRSEKAVVVTISTRARDRHGDVIDPEGVRLDRFRKNPVVLYAHDYGGLPVAKSLWERIRPDGEHVELIAKPQFHLQTELSREVWALVEKGVLSAWSIGFIPEEWEPQDAGSGGGKGFRVRRWDLLEYSCVPVPANFQALTHELKARRITAPALVKSLAPLGLKAPDLVAQEVRATEVTEDTEGNGNKAGPAAGSHSHSETSVAMEEQDEKKPALDEPAAGKQGSGERGIDKAVLHDLRASVVRRIVGRAFETVLRRARGEGFVKE